MVSLVLASTSPRRKELLGNLGFGRSDFQFEIVSPDIDETPFFDEQPRDYVQRLAAQKALAGLAICTQIAEPSVLGSDTVVVLENQILGKPADEADAKRILTALSGKSHTVMTAVALANRDHTEVRLVETQVRFCVLTDTDIDAYIATKEPMDKAGGYGIQGLGGCFVEAIDGSYSSVVGLPLVETRELLVAAGIL
ncbi:Maf family nucleotide pyrophosphatase [Shewanella sp. A25]|nr:Maf family nucleotide pyrophosphatase [Shewanella shenzhenensis]